VVPPSAPDSIPIPSSATLPPPTSPRSPGIRLSPPGTSSWPSLPTGSLSLPAGLSSRSPPPS
jgi:hypothetical protein